VKDRRIAATADAQHGVFSIVQALACGFTKKEIRTRLRTYRWEPVLPGVFRLRGAPRTWRQMLMAAYLWASRSSAAVSHRSAAALWGLDGFVSGVVEISTTGRVRDRAATVTVHRVRRLLRQEIRELDGIPTTNVARTLIDVCGSAPSQLAERALDDALRRRFTSVPEMWNYLRLEARHGRSGAATLRRLLEARDAHYRPPDSQLSRRLERLILASALPKPERQYPIFRKDVLVRVFDLCYPQAKLAIEADGYKPHSGRIPWSKDQTKDNRMTALGWATLRYTANDIDERPDQIIEETGTVLELRLRLLCP
jgi:very-short-patch-repair endonuclease/predicted transcriptional regulator of viral defense system